MHALAITWNELEIHSVGRKYVDSTSVTSDHCTQLSNKIILHDFTTYHPNLAKSRAVNAI